MAEAEQLSEEWEARQRALANQMFADAAPRLSQIVARCKTICAQTMKDDIVVLGSHLMAQEEQVLDSKNGL
jgi:hypothetical protein